MSRNLHKNSQSYLCGNKGTIKLSCCENRFSNSKRYSKKNDSTRAFRYTHVSRRWRAFFPVVFSLSIYSNPLRISNVRWINIDTFFEKKSKAFNLTFFVFSNISWIINSCTSFQWWWLSSILSFYFASFFPQISLSDLVSTPENAESEILLDITTGKLRFACVRFVCKLSQKKKRYQENSMETLHFPESFQTGWAIFRLWIFACVSEEHAFYWECLQQANCVTWYL